MDFRGEYVTKWVGSGSNGDPGLAMQEEDETGLFLFNPGTSSGLSVTKRGVEQARFSDGKITFFEPVTFSGGTGSAFTGQVYLIDGTGSAPSMAFNSDNKTGIYKKASGTIGVSSLGTAVMDIGSTKMDLFVPLVMNGNSISASTISAGSGSLSVPSVSIGSSSTGFSFNTSSQLMSLSIGGASAAQLSSTSCSVGASTIQCGVINATANISSFAGYKNTNQTFLRLFMATNTTTILNASTTNIIWDAQDSANNWVVTLPVTSLTIPATGTYLVTYNLGMSSAAGAYKSWMLINSGTRLYGEDINIGLGGNNVWNSMCFIYPFTIGDTIVMQGFQNSGSSQTTIGLTASGLDHSSIWQLQLIG